ncbi:MAG: hypothetical protein F4W95_06380 [Chloroflexi bacterium]|nr:hypothetical protein [Chloroflexota bacterium]MYD48096.1 hypothetical protein [Chloroflexota bacterium]
MTRPRQYEQRYNTLPPVRDAIESRLLAICSDLPHIDRITCRVKTPESFAKKADKLDAEGWPIYEAPLSQIQDQIGTRILVLYLSDIRKIEEAVLPHFQEAEHKAIEPGPASFGYFGEHWLLAIPNNLIPSMVDPEDVPPFFELQVKTLFQHAWSEAEHDLGYKSPQLLTPSQRRLFAYASAQAWGADRVFEELFGELVVEENTDGLTSTAQHKIRQQSGRRRG